MTERPRERLRTELDLSRFDDLHRPKYTHEASDLLVDLRGRLKRIPQFQDALAETYLHFLTVGRKALTDGHIRFARRGTEFAVRYSIDDQGRNLEIHTVRNEQVERIRISSRQTDGLIVSVTEDKNGVVERLHDEAAAYIRKKREI